MSFSHSSFSQSFSQIAFPIARQVMSTTLAGKDFRILEEIKLYVDKENRLRKIRILRSGEFIPEMKVEEHERYEEYNNSGDIISVKPLSAPTGKLFYMDFKK